MATSYIPLEGGLTQSIGNKAVSFSTSDIPTLFSSASLIYVFFFVVIVVAASFRYAYAGMLRMQASEKGIKDSKEEFSRVTYGLLGVFSLWLILATVNKDMLSGDIGLDAFKLGPSTSYTGGGTGGLVQTGTVTGKTPTVPIYNNDPTGWKAITDDAAIRAQLKNLPNGGISVKRPVCSNPALTQCTTLGGVHPDTIAMLSSLRTQCSGTIAITGGSENGHSSHGIGKTPVDLSINSQGGLNDCIRSFTPGPTLNWCKKTYRNFGYIFCDENGTPHWHVYKG